MAIPSSTYATKLSTTTVNHSGSTGLKERERDDVELLALVGVIDKKCDGETDVLSLLWFVVECVKEVVGETDVLSLLWFVVECVKEVVGEREKIPVSLLVTEIEIDREWEIELDSLLLCCEVMEGLVERDGDGVSVFDGVDSNEEVCVGSFVREGVGVSVSFAVEVNEIVDECVTECVSECDTVSES